MAVQRIKKVSNTTLSYRWKSFVKMKNQISMPDDTNPYAGGRPGHRTHFDGKR